MSGAMGPINPSDYVVKLNHEPTWTASFVEGVVNWEEAGGVWKLAAYVAAFVVSFMVLVSVVFSPAFFTCVREYEAIHLEKEFQKQVPTYGAMQTTVVTEVAGKMTEDQARELVVNVQLQKALLSNPDLMAQLIKDPGLRRQI